MVPPIPMAPNGTPGVANVLLDMPLGTLWITGPGRRYIWTISIHQHGGCTRRDRILGTGNPPKPCHRRTPRRHVTVRGPRPFRF